MLFADQVEGYSLTQHLLKFMPPTVEGKLSSKQIRMLRLSSSFIWSSGKGRYLHLKRKRKNRFRNLIKLLFNHTCTLSLTELIYCKTSKMLKCMWFVLVSRVILTSYIIAFHFHYTVAWPVCALFVTDLLSLQHILVNFATQFWHGMP